VCSCVRSEEGYVGGGRHQTGESACTTRAVELPCLFSVSVALGYLTLAYQQLGSAPAGAPRDPLNVVVMRWVGHGRWTDSRRRWVASWVIDRLVECWTAAQESLIGATVSVVCFIQACLLLDCPGC